MRNTKTRNAAAARELKQLAQRELLSLHVLELDVTQDASVEQAVHEVVAKCERIDVLVNNAGYGIMDLSETVTVAQAQRQLDVNFFGVLRMNRAVLPIMKRHRSGLLLHVSSGAGRLAIPGMGLYCASKFAMEALAETYRYELASQGIDSVILETARTPLQLQISLRREKTSSGGQGTEKWRKLPGKSCKGSEAHEPTRRKLRTRCCKSLKHRQAIGNSGIALAGAAGVSSASTR